MRNLLAFVVLIFVVGFSARADLYDVPRVEAVMKKKYSLKDEISFELGYMPTGAFSKYVPIGGSYTTAFNENHGWEVLNALYAYEMQTGLKKTLLAPAPDGYGDLVKDADLATLKYLVTTNYIFSPIYTKSLIFNSSMIHSQLSFVAGGGVAGFNIGGVPVADLGLIQRIFTSKTKSWKFDFRYYNFFSSVDTVKNNISLLVAYTWSLGE